MRWTLCCLTLVSLVACKEDSTSIDAALPPVDARKTVDAPANACTGKLYDPCTMNTQCMSQNCKAFGAAGFQVCTQACSTAMPCPNQGSTPVPCNNMGICRPAVANTCP